VIALELEEIAVLCPGRLEPAAGAARVTGVQIDSRRITPGDLFVAVGEGAAFADDARAAGAAAVLVPDDAFEALAALARAVRGRSSARVVGITGSTGKTSTKDILAAICVLRARTVAAEASYNNELGVPLTLCRLEPETEICIVEIAMRGLGQIASMADVARPEIAIVTNVGPAHVELVGSLEAVAEAKSELIDALPGGGTAIVPLDFPVARDDIAIVRVGEPVARVEGGTTRIELEGREIVFDFQARHQARNAVAALHAARALGLEVDGRVHVTFSPWRGEEVVLPGGGLLVNDCWNANPISMQAALEDLVDRAEGQRTVAVLGDMAELGSDASAYHRELGALAAALGVDVLVAVGPLARGYLDGGETIPITAWAPTACNAVAAALPLIEPGDRVLVKGSRSVGLEVVAGALAGVQV
jgi:UDP-N-acetylmuramoyl-tripeptide--D-alanyl-D-alanine ligase